MEYVEPLSTKQSWKRRIMLEELYYLLSAYSKAMELTGL